MDEDIRSSIESSINTLEGTPASSGTPSPAPAPSGGASGTPGSAAPGYATPAPAPAAAPGATQVAPPASTPPGSIPSKEGVPDTSEASGEPRQNIGTVAESKPPGTWTPEAREHWKNLDPEVRNNIIRRERETSRAMTQSTDARMFKKTFDQAIQPFMGFIAAERSDPIKATVNMMQTAAMLRTGTPIQKAELVAGVIKQFGIDLQTLDGLLAGQVPNPNDPAQAFERLLNQRLGPIQQKLQTYEQRERQVLQELDQEVDQELSDFAGAHEFYDDVKDIMADMMEVDQRRGGNMSLTQAYERATLLSDPVRLTLEKRRTGQSAQRTHEIAQQARSGAFSVKPSDEAGSTVPKAPGDSIRDAITWALEKTASR